MRYSFPHSPPHTLPPHTPSPRTHMQHRFFSSAYLYLVLFLFSLQVLTTGWLNRRVASTSMNRESSRSHAVFTLTIQSKKRVGMFTPLLHHLVSPTMLMSSPLPHHVHTLTGEQGFCSQDQNFTAEFGGLSWLRKTARHSHCRTQTEGRTASPLPSFLSLLSLLFLHPHLSPSLSLPTRSQEAGSINKSLSALGNVIMALVDITHGKSRHVHYRDSKLTFLLRVCHVVYLPQTPGILVLLRASLVPGHLPRPQFVWWREQ